MQGACIHRGPLCLFLLGISNRWHGHHYPTQELILKDSVVSFLWTARTLCLHPLILIQHQVKATPRGTKLHSTLSRGKASSRNLPWDSYQWNMLEW